MLMSFRPKGVQKLKKHSQTESKQQEEKKTTIFANLTNINSTEVSCGAGARASPTQKQTTEQVKVNTHFNEAV